MAKNLAVRCHVPQPFIGCVGLVKKHVPLIVHVAHTLILFAWDTAIDVSHFSLLHTLGNLPQF
jgi:hypothetical protein